MRIQVVTSLYPLPDRPHEGIFAERRWSGMARRGHEVELLHPLPRAFLPSLPGRWGPIARAPAREVRSGVPIRRPRYLHLPRQARGNAARFAQVAERELAPAVDIVVCDYAWPASRLAARLARCGGPPCVVNGRGSDIMLVAGEAGLGDLLASDLACASAYCAVSEHLVRRMDELSGFPERGVLVANGVDTELFFPRERAAARRELALPVDAPVLLVVGHWIERKDPLLALAAFAAGAPPQATLFFVGRGPLEGELRAGITRHALQGRVHLVGERPPEELARWYAACDVVLLTSKREGRPNVVLEALASGRPVVATEAGGTSEILRGTLGVVPTREPQEIGRRIAQLLIDSPGPEELRAAVEDLSWEASFKRLEALLESCCSGAGVPR